MENGGFFRAASLNNDHCEPPCEKFPSVIASNTGNQRTIFFLDWWWWWSWNSYGHTFRLNAKFNLIELFSSFLLNFIMSCLIEFLSVEVGSNDLVFRRGERRIFVNRIKIKIIQWLSIIDTYVIIKATSFRCLLIILNLKIIREY